METTNLPKDTEKPNYFSKEDIIATIETDSTQDMKNIIIDTIKTGSSEVMMNIIVAISNIWYHYNYLYALLIYNEDYKYNKELSDEFNHAYDDLIKARIMMNVVNEVYFLYTKKNGRKCFLARGSAAREECWKKFSHGNETTFTRSMGRPRKS